MQKDTAAEVRHNSLQQKRDKAESGCPRKAVTEGFVQIVLRKNAKIAVCVLHNEHWT